MSIATCYDIDRYKIIPVLVRGREASLQGLPCRLAKK